VQGRGARRRWAEECPAGDRAIDRSSFAVLHDEWADPVRAYLARRVGAQLAEELTAQTFTEAWAGLDRFDPSKGMFGSWLFGIATNLVRRHARHEERTLRLASRLAHQAHVASAEDQVLDRIVAHGSWPRVAEAMAAMSRADRDVLFLFVHGELTYEEIAEALGIAVGTVRSRLARARARLTARLLASSYSDDDEPVVDR
jgi:RNA polymerase sigma factor (sigma-70 family)